jgi:hypothetical protein
MASKGKHLEFKKQEGKKLWIPAPFFVGKRKDIDLNQATRILWA